MTEKDTWEPLSEPTARILARWSEEQRRVFQRECESDGVKQKTKGENEDARV